MKWTFYICPNIIINSADLLRIKINLNLFSDLSSIYVDGLCTHDVPTQANNISWLQSEQRQTYIGVSVQFIYH